MQNAIVHYDEIGLKGKNRIVFEKQLISNVKSVLKDQAAGSLVDVKRLYGRLLLVLKPEANVEKVTQALRHVFGIANFAFASKVSFDIEAIEKQALEQMSDKAGNFRVTTQRSDKNFPLSSQEINVRVGAAINKKHSLAVKLEKPDNTCFIEIANGSAFIYTKKIQGPGGLPVGVSGKMVVMLSGGIDSPVAAWQIMKRGAQIIPVHFHSAPFTSEFSIEKVRELTEVLKKFQPNMKLYEVAFADVQRKIMMSVPEKFRIIFYRRFMMRIAQRIAQKEKAKAIITGEALGQVASQTIENMTATSEVLSMPVLRPLIGFDKKDIIKKAQSIGTLEISQQPHDDCCTLFAPRQVETKAKLSEIHIAEQALDVEQLTKTAADAAEVARL